MNDEDDPNLGEIGVGWEENVFRFQITVDDVLAVQVLQCHQDLEHEHDDDDDDDDDDDEDDEDDDEDDKDLGNEELGDPLGESTLLRRENHLQHVTWIETLFRIIGIINMIR